MKKKLMALGLLIYLAGITPHTVFAATQVDSLVEKLVEKGILTKSEAVELKAEIIQDEKVAREEGLKQSLPEWVANTKLKGDLRLRYQYERKKNDIEHRGRGRYRYRLGLENQVNDKLKVGAGLASGGEDPRSTNQTFQDTFERSDVRLDLAYAEYAPAPWGKIIGGVFPKKDYLWTPDDLLWDTDINPTGGAIHLEKPMASNKVTPFLNSGFLMLDESSVGDSSSKDDKADPFVTYVQGGLKWKDQPEGEKFDATAAGTYYAFNSVKGTNLDWCAGTNTGRTSGSTSAGACTGTPKYDFDSVGASAEFGVRNLLGGLPFRIDDRIAIFSDFIHNVDPTDDQNGWAFGTVFGHKKVANWGHWQAKYQYSYLGKDAWLDTFPDSDRYSGGTDVKGHEIVFDLGLSKNVSLGLDYYQDQKIKGTKNLQHLWQADMNFKF